jgi:hypothetical protein
MQTQTPCTDYVETKGLIYFARMLDKIRLKAAGKLPSEYFTGVEDPTHFDARCTRLLGVNYDELVKRTLEGGSNEEILEWCFARGRRPNDEESAAGGMTPARNLQNPKEKRVSATATTYKLGWTCMMSRRGERQLSPKTQASRYPSY